MKKILLCSDGSAFAENTYRYGAWFATNSKAESVLFCDRRIFRKSDR
ncbi:MAG: hypothetical protein AAF383_28765 [Cyanobacteria bacterium P01_A01_bin.83]